MTLSVPCRNMTDADPRIKTLQKRLDDLHAQCEGEEQRPGKDISARRLTSIYHRMDLTMKELEQRQQFTGKPLPPDRSTNHFHGACGLSEAPQAHAAM